MSQGIAANVVGPFVDAFRRGEGETAHIPSLDAEFTAMDFATLARSASREGRLGGWAPLWIARAALG